MNVHSANNSSIIHKFQTEAARAGVDDHVSKRQISGLLKEIKNTGEKLTLQDCAKLRESVGKLRDTLAEQGSKMLKIKSANLDKIGQEISKISSQLKPESILKNTVSGAGESAKKSISFAGK